jgi:hypothetical protein
MAEEIDEESYIHNESIDIPRESIQFKGLVKVDAADMS